ncbi:NADH dehydrogenase (ubiquinone) 1 beta subcomplex subunit 8, partial [Tremellales sp. Uapishka_1]
MFRSVIQRSLPRTLPATRRLASTSSSTSQISTRLAPGEEIDPQLDGYPQLPWVSLQTREPKGWWDQQERKNFGEVMHEEEDALGMWSPDVFKTSGPSALLQISLAFGGIAIFGYFLSQTAPSRPVAARSYPFGGLEKELGGKNAARVEEDEED